VALCAIADRFALQLFHGRRAARMPSIPYLQLGKQPCSYRFSGLRPESLIEVQDTLASVLPLIPEGDLRASAMNVSFFPSGQGARWGWLGEVWPAGKKPWTAQFHPAELLRESCVRPRTASRR